MNFFTIATAGISEATFADRQKIRDQYQTYADTLRGIIDQVPARMQPEVKAYLNHVAQVIARGATAQDLSEFEAKLKEWSALESQLVATPTIKPVTIAVSPTVGTRKQAVSEPVVDLPKVNDLVASLKEIPTPALIAGGLLLYLLLKR